MLTKALVSRVIFQKALTNANKAVTQSKRNSGHGVWSYRVPPPAPSKFSRTLATVMGGICWYWILYHIATEPEHIYGEWPYIDPATYSDEELGIPPDSAGSLKK